METKDNENTKNIQRRDNSGKGFERLEMQFEGKKYDVKFNTITEEKKKDFMHDMHYTYGLNLRP